LEFVLKLEEFAPLREVPRYMQVLCPTNNESQVVINDMIDQVMSLHPNIKYFHIGSDEVYHIGMCHLCQDRMAKFKIQESHLFLQHVKTVAEHVKSRYNVQPLMWDDEFRKLDENVILQSGLGSLVEIVVWNYSFGIKFFLEY
jgi:hexosaminidase